MMLTRRTGLRRTRADFYLKVRFIRFLSDAENRKAGLCEGFMEIAFLGFETGDRNRTFLAESMEGIDGDYAIFALIWAREWRRRGGLVRNHLFADDLDR